jgi:hypothetical protein
MKKLVLYADYLGEVHLRCILNGYIEHHCLIADGAVIIKLVKYVVLQ